MDPEKPKQQLGDITTIWGEVRDSQSAGGLAAQRAQESLFQRYSGAVRRYLLAALGDAAVAEDLVQEFALALVEGKFRQADPQHGRFRDYIKGVLFHLVSQYRRRQKKQPVPVAAALAQQADEHGTDSDQQFNQSWRDALMARAWVALADAQPTYFTVLHFRAVHPDLPEKQMAAELEPQLGRPIQPDNLRQILHRARKMFADFLMADVTQSLKHPTIESVKQELSDLGLEPFFRSVRGSAHA
jgi:RNA polymerase sigma factor (sigma-70 family)